jgi:hypothetical protein
MARFTDSDNGYKDLEKYIDIVFHEYKEHRRTVEPLWQEISDYLLPQFSNWKFESRFGEHHPIGDKIFDGSAIAAHSRLADGIFGWLVSPTIPWLAFEPLDPNDREDHTFMKYLKDLEMYLYDVFNRSNFYDSMAEDIRNSSGIGTSIMTIEDAEPLGRPIYTPLHPREGFISENRWREADTLFRQYEVTPRQFLEEFKDVYTDKKQIKEISEKRGNIVLLHAVYPNLEFIDDGGLKLGENKRYKSVHKIVSGVDKPRSQETTILKVSGMDERRFEAHRFSRSSGMVYGRSPAMDAIYDIKMLNVQAKTMADVAQLAARPPVQTSEMMKGKLRIAPGGITYGMDPVAPIMTNFSYPIGIDAMQRREQIIKEHFKTEFFQSISQLQNTARDRTATEVMEIKAEAAAVMGSIVGRFQSERLDPMIRMTMLIEKEAKRLPPFPEGVDPEKVFALKFVGPLAQSQNKYLRVNGIVNGLGKAIEFSMASQRPDLLMNFDLDWAIRELATSNGYNPQGFIPVKEVQKQRQAQAEQQQAMMQEQMNLERMKAAGGPKAADPESAAAAFMGR